MYVRILVYVRMLEYVCILMYMCIIIYLRIVNTCVCTCLFTTVVLDISNIGNIDFFFLLFLYLLFCLC